MNKTTTLLLAIALPLLGLLAGCDKSRHELEQARTETKAAEGHARELQAKLTDANEQLTTAQTGLAAAQIEINTLKETIQELNAELQVAAKAADEAALTQLNLLLQFKKKEEDHQTQIESLTAKIDELVKKVRIP